MLKKPRSRFLVMSFSALAVLLMLLSACGGPTSSTGTTPTTGGGTPVKGGTWVDDLFEEPDSLIPNASNETFAAMMDYGLYAAMLYTTPGGTVMPGLVTSVPSVTNGGISTDLKTWKFTFRSGLKWSDGQTLDARDMDFTWKLWANPKFGSINTIAVSDITSADVSSDNLTITFHLKTGLVSFYTYFTDGYFGPMPMHHYATMDPAAILKSPDNLNPSVVSGPFMMSESKPTDHYTMVRNPNYYQAAQGLPYLDKVVWRIVPNQNTILTDLQAGTPDSSWFLDVSKAISYQSLSNYKVVADPHNENFEALYFDFHNKILANNPEIRKAMSMAVDQTTLIQVARRGLAGAACTDHPAQMVPGHFTGTCPKFDLAAANALLDSNGWTKGADGYRSKNGQRLEFQYSTTAGNLWRSDDQLINQQNFKAIGIKLDIQDYPASTLFGTFLTDGKPGVYDIVEYETGVGVDPDDASLLQCNNPGNTTYYCNPALDALYKVEQGTADPTARQAAFDKIHQIYLTDNPFIVEFTAPDVAVHKNGTEGYAPGLVNQGEEPNVWLWWCDGGKCP
jgi:peptide/nickel transport system substrate-binding protein